jgi:biopolymer transport protein ExbD
MRKPPKATSLALNLAPMVDVMMCLLIFFMLATKMVEQEKSRIALPVAPSAHEVDKQPGETRFVINIRPNNADNQPVYIIREEELPLNDVLRRLSAAASVDRDLQCVIRADRDIAYKHVEAVMLGCAQSGIHHITFGALRRDEGGRS